MKKVAGTGHRWCREGLYSPQEMLDFMGFLKRVVTLFFSMSDLSPSLIIAGGALGFDIALAEYAIQAQIPLYLALPGEWFGQKWELPFQKILDRHKRKAHEIVYIDQILPHSLGKEYHPAKMQWRNEHMVNHCDILLAYWNGHRAGGTYNCIKYAMKHSFEIINLWENYPYDPTK